MLSGEEEEGSDYEEGATDKNLSLVAPFCVLAGDNMV